MPKSQLAIALDGRKIALNLASSHFPDPAELRTGCGFIQLEFTAKMAPLSPGNRFASHKSDWDGLHLHSSIDPDRLPDALQAKLSWAQSGLEPGGSWT